MADKRHILIVDDEAAQRELLEGFVKPMGFEVQCVGSAEDAIQHIGDQRPVLKLEFPHFEIGNI